MTCQSGFDSDRVGPGLVEADAELPRRDAERAAFSAPNQRRILDACPHATEVRNFLGWLAAGRAVRKGQKGIHLVAPDSIDGGKGTSFKPVWVFDVSQTDELSRRAAA